MGFCVGSLSYVVVFSALSSFAGCFTSLLLKFNRVLAVMWLSVLSI